jgi:N-acyl-D-amino-acid deacylase
VLDASIPARRLGAFDRRMLRVGACADAVCFDLEWIIDQASYERPRELASGVDTVLS